MPKIDKIKSILQNLDAQDGQEILPEKINNFMLVKFRSEAFLSSEITFTILILALDILKDSVGQMRSICWWSG